MNNLNLLFFSVLKVDLDLKQSDVQQQLEKLRQHEQRLIATDEQLRKKEVEIDSKVQEAKIETENKYRVSALRNSAVISWLFISLMFERRLF